MEVTLASRVDRLLARILLELNPNMKIQPRNVIQGSVALGDQQHPLKDAQQQIDYRYQSA